MNWMFPNTALVEYIHSSKDNGLKSLKRSAGTESSGTNSPLNVAIPSIHVTEVLIGYNSQASFTQIKGVIMADVEDLLRRGTFKAILNEELTDGSDTLSGSLC